MIFISRWINVFTTLQIENTITTNVIVFLWCRRRDLSWICSTLTEFRLKALWLSRLNLFAIWTNSLRSCRPSANPLNPQFTD